MTRITAIASQKGGTGKTAVAAALGAMLALAGLRTLLVDLDQQADLTALCGHDATTLALTVVDVLAPLDPVPAVEAIVPAIHGLSTLHLLASDSRAAGLERRIVSELGRERLLSDALKPVRGAFDAIVVDCPPSLGDLTINGLCAANDVIVPVSMEDKNSLQGAIHLLETLRKLRAQDQRVALKTLVRVKADSSRQAHRALPLERDGYPVAHTELRTRADWNNAAVEGAPVVLWAPASDAAADARALAAELWPEIVFPFPSEIRARVRQLRSPSPGAVA